MAMNSAFSGNCFKKLLLSGCQYLNNVRFATRYSRNKTRGKGRGWKRQDGNFVFANEILVKQLGMRFYPGENVGLAGDNTLYALSDGKVIVSCEKLTPYPDSPLYEPIQSGLVVYKKFFHVVATPLHGKFRLLSQV